VALDSLAHSPKLSTVVALNSVDELIFSTFDMQNCIPMVCLPNHNRNVHTVSHRIQAAKACGVMI